MKAVTHDLFSVGLLLYVVTLLGVATITTVAYVVVVAALTNALVDGIGHSKRDGIPKRGWVTHSVVTAPVWGAVACLLVLAVPYAVGLVSLGPVVAFLALLGALAGWSHLLLDSLTEGGVFGLGLRRLALAHYRYDNTPLNLCFGCLGVALILAAVFR